MTKGRGRHWAKSPRYLKEIVLRAIEKLARAFGHDLIFHLSLVLSHLPFQTALTSRELKNEKLPMQNGPSFEP
jgi:hypothetical protein